MDARRATLFFCCISAGMLFAIYYIDQSKGFKLKFKIAGLNGFTRYAHAVVFNTTVVSRKNQARKLILVYTPLFGNNEWYHLPGNRAQNYTSEVGCEYHNCEITYDNNRYKDSDVAIFHARDMPDPHFLNNLRRESPKQRWVYFIAENPINTPNARPLDGLFNWTMTYKKESDIWVAYHRFLKRPSSMPIPKVIDYAARKNKVPQRKLAFWVSSHCGTFRDNFATKLQDLISLDVGGGCGRLFKNNIQDCNSNGRPNCMARIKDYKFYLSFENAFCDQYVTEKYWYNALQHDAVPIVLGGGPYNDPKVAVPGSFIDAQSFNSVKDLANYLIYLDKNDTAYNEYFAWKQTYMLPTDRGWPYPDIWSCEICKKLNNDEPSKVYDKLSNFWNVADCRGRDNKAVDMVNKG